MFKASEIKAVQKELMKIKEIFAIILYGSYATKQTNERSDLDICLVLKTDDKEKIKQVYQKTLILSGKNEKYDVKIFELLPLKLKIEVVSEGKILHTRNFSELQEYFYFYRKLWQDQSINWLEKKNLI